MLMEAPVTVRFVATIVRIIAETIVITFNAILYFLFMVSISTAILLFLNVLN